MKTLTGAELALRRVQAGFGRPGCDNPDAYRALVAQAVEHLAGTARRLGPRRWKTCAWRSSRPTAPATSTAPARRPPQRISGPQTAAPPTTRPRGLPPAWRRPGASQGQGRGIP
jgi:hypothetical protein